MPAPCSTCTHVDRDLIDAALAGGAPKRRVATHYALTESTVRRHGARHLPATLARAVNAAEVSRADALLGQVDDLRDRALEILDQAQESGDLRTALSAIGQARGCLELLGRLAGELQDGATVNVVISAEWVQLRSTILATLDPWPQARIALAAALASETA